MKTQQKSPHEVLYEETVRLERIVENANGQYQRMQQVDALLELAQLWQKDTNRAWRYISEARDLTRGWQ
jgi:hypothetical protein